jgi:hypothetical protein
LSNFREIRDRFNPCVTNQRSYLPNALNKNRALDAILKATWRSHFPQFEIPALRRGFRVGKHLPFRHFEIFGGTRALAGCSAFRLDSFPNPELLNSEKSVIIDGNFWIFFR